VNDTTVQMLPPIGRRYRDHYSYSSLDTFERCGFSFAKRYLTDGKAPPALADARAAADTGKLVHSVNEEAAEGIVRTGYRGPIPVDRLLALYWRKFAQTDLVGIDWALIGEDCLQLWAKRIGSLPHVAEVEHRFDLLIDGARLMGYIDRIDRLPDGTVVVTDYKTGKYRPSQRELESSLQMGIYAAVAWRLYPDAPAVVVALDLMRHDYQLTATMTRDKADNVLKYARALITRIEEAPDAFEPKLNGLCGWCDWRATCPAWKAATRSPIGTPAADLTDIDSACAEYAHLTAAEGLIKKRKSEIAKVVRTHLEADNLDELEAGGKTFKVIGTTSRTYPVKSVLARLETAGVPHDLYDALTLDQKRVSALLKKIGAGDALTREQVTLLEAELHAIAKTRRGQRLAVR